MPRKKADEPDMSGLAEETENAETAYEEGEPLTGADPPEAEPPQPSDEAHADVSAETDATEYSFTEYAAEAGEYGMSADEPDAAPDPAVVAQDAVPPTAFSEDSAQEPEPPARRRPSSRRRKSDDISEAETNSDAANIAPDRPQPDRTMRLPARRRSSEPQILTIESRAEVETPEEREDILWHEIQNAHRTRKILTGVLGGVEQNEARKTIAIVYYKELRVAIPLVEMNITLADTEDQTYDEIMRRQNKILGNMLGAEIDFVVRGIDAKSRSVVGSRREAMLKKRQLFYFGTDANGQNRLYEDRIVQARVIAVAEKGIRVEVFGVECSIMARDLSWDWVGDAHERYSVGDEILVRILSIRRETLEDVSIRADVRSVAGESGRENLKKCRVQGKYAGTVTDVHKGVVFVRLSIGVNAVAHSCYDNRTPGKKDEVSFAVTHIDEERNVAVGIITRIIKQRL